MRLNYNGLFKVLIDKNNEKYIYKIHDKIIA